MTNNLPIKKLTLSLAGLILTFGFISFLTVINPYSYGTSTKDSNRTPASIGLTKAASSEVKAKFISETIKFACNSSKTNPVILNEKTNQVRITGKHCMVEGTPFEFTQIENQTNKFQATVFELRHKKFSSDLIHIDEGLNVIEIEESSPEGLKKISKIYLKRPTTL